MTAGGATVRPRLTQTVIALGVVSLCMDLSSEIVHALLPIFLTTTLGASVAVVGVIDGAAEATASITKVFSGWLSDRLAKRKPLILFGYSLAALSKPLFALATSPALVFGARFADRIGKGIRGAPRDALIADVTPAELRGRAYGLRQALDTAGAVLGPLAAIGLMAIFSGDLRSVFWIAAIPAFAAALVVLTAVSDRERNIRDTPATPLRIADIGRLGPDVAHVTMIGVVFTLARFSEAFLILKAVDAGISLDLAPAALAVMSLAYSLGAYPAGALADRIPPDRLLLAGLAALLAADLILALSHDIIVVFAGIALWGAHMALTQGLFAKLIAGAAPADLVGTAFGAFNLATGVAALFASLFAGLLWTSFGPTATFAAGGGFAMAAVVLTRLRR